MIKAIIIEDEQNSAILLEQMINDIETDIVVIEKCSDLPEGVKSIKRNNPDIVFLDIELPVYSGIQLLEFFNPEELTFSIIFTTASNEYAIRAFEMSAVDYLTKPIKEEKLKIAIEKALRNRLSQRNEIFPILKQNFLGKNQGKIVVPIASGFEILNLNDICYFKAEGSYTQIYFNRQPCLLVSKNLKHFEFILAGIHNFVRIHRSYILNINFAKKLLKTDGGSIWLENNTELPVSEEKMIQLIEMIKRL